MINCILIVFPYLISDVSNSTVMCIIIYVSHFTCYERGKAILTEFISNFNKKNLISINVPLPSLVYFSFVISDNN